MLHNTLAVSLTVYIVALITPSTGATRANLARADEKPTPRADATSQPASTQGKLAPLLEEIRKRRKVPALAGAIVRRGETVALGVSGVRQARRKPAVEINDAFHLGSCTKSMTATLCAMLVEEGKLKWNSTVGDVFTDLRERIDPAFHAVTLEQLLCHRSGLPQDTRPDFTIFPKLLALEGPLKYQRREMIEIVMGRPPSTQPGSAYAYANFGIAIAGAMCEAATGESYEDLMQRMLFEPLGMTTAGFGAPGSAQKIDAIRGHDDMALWQSPVLPGARADNPQVIAPAGTVHTSIGDWAKYAALHLDGACERPRLLKADSFARLHSDPFQQEYGYGWSMHEKEWAGGRVMAHDGSNGRWYAVIVIAPKRDAAYLVATNAASESAVEACGEAIKALREYTPAARAE